MFIPAKQQKLQARLKKNTEMKRVETRRWERGVGEMAGRW
jgi:hypothetical protein